MDILEMTAVSHISLQFQDVLLWLCSDLQTLWCGVQKAGVYQFYPILIPVLPAIHLKDLTEVVITPAFGLIKWKQF